MSKQKIEGCWNEPKTPNLCKISKQVKVGFEVDFCDHCNRITHNYGKVGETKQSKATTTKTKKKKEQPRFINDMPINEDVSIVIDKVFIGDFREHQHKIPNKSVKLIIVDLPYGTTDAEWDVLIPFEDLWEFWNRIIVDGGVIALFGDQPFLTDIINSNRENYRYSWYWKKNILTKHQMAKSHPMKCIEQIAIFYNERGTFNTEVDTKNKKKHKQSGSELYGEMKHNGDFTKAIAHNELLIFDKESGQHSTQKPVPLLEFLIDVYTEPGDLVHDTTAGSGTVAVACIHTKRKYVICELLPKHGKVIEKRIKEANNKITLGFEFESKLQPKKHDKHTGKQGSLEFEE